MDLGDFVPETYDWGFSVEGRKYRFKYEEITVDEMLRLLNQGDPGEHYADGARRSVTAFLQKVCVEGDPKQLAADLAKVPFRREGALCIEALYQRIQSRVKKNGRGATTPEAA